MIISDSHHFIFIHIRKAAGVSVRNQLKPYAISRPDDLLSKIKSKSGIEKDYQRFYFQMHSDLMSLKKRMPEEKFSNYFKFAYVRNPWKRVLSEYLYIRSKPEHGRYKKVIKMSFDEYIIYQAKRFDAHQVNMLCDKNGKLQLDFTAKFENLQNDWKHICDKIQIEYKALAHLNKNKTFPTEEYFTQKNKLLIEKLWQRDIEMFEYTFED